MSYFRGRARALSVQFRSPSQGTLRTSRRFSLMGDYFGKSDRGGNNHERCHLQKGAAQTLKPATVNRELDTLKSILSRAVESGRLDSPARLVKRLHVENQRTHILAIDLAHAPSAEGGFDRVRAQGRARREWHRAVRQCPGVSRILLSRVTLDGGTNRGKLSPTEVGSPTPSVRLGLPSGHSTRLRAWTRSLAGGIQTHSRRYRSFRRQENRRS